MRATLFISCTWPLTFRRIFSLRLEVLTNHDENDCQSMARTFEALFLSPLALDFRSFRFYAIGEAADSPPASFYDN